MPRHRSLTPSVRVELMIPPALYGLLVGAAQRAGLPIATFVRSLIAREVHASGAETEK